LGRFGRLGVKEFGEGPRKRRKVGGTTNLLGTTILTKKEVPKNYFPWKGFPFKAFRDKGLIWEGKAFLLRSGIGFTYF